MVAKPNSVGDRLWIKQVLEAWNEINSGAIQQLAQAALEDTAGRRVRRLNPAVFADGQNPVERVLDNLMHEHIDLFEAL